MIVKERFSDVCYHYENFEVWDVENMDAFFKGNEIIATIFEDLYKFPVSEFNTRRSEITEDDLGVISSLLDHVGDKYFYVFSLHDSNHLNLIQMQQDGVMNFGLDIEQIQPTHFYVLIMDKRGDS